jgi:hypothetical protein
VRPDPQLYAIKTAVPQSPN